MAMYCVLSAAGDHNTNADPNDIIFTIKDTKLYVLVVFLSKLLSKGFERSVWWNEYKTKSENIIFLESNYVGTNRLFAWV